MNATRTAYLLSAPSLLGVAAFLVLPILVLPILVVAVWPALQHWDLIGPRTFVGLDTVAAVASDGRFAPSLLLTATSVITTGARRRRRRPRRWRSCHSSCCSCCSSGT